MNIMLTDLRSLTLDVQEIPVVADSGAGSFAGLFHQQFPEVTTEGEQVFDFKQYIENEALQADTSAATLEVSLTTPSQEPSTPIQDATKAASPASPENLNSLLAGRFKPVAEFSAEQPLQTEAGEPLPVGGNQLPPQRLLDKADPDMRERLAEAPLTTAVTPPVIAAVEVAAPQKPPTPEAITKSATVEPGATILHRVNASIAPSTVAPVIVQQKVASAESKPSVATLTPVEIRPVSENGRPGDAGLVRNPVARAELASSRAEVVPGAMPQTPAAPVIAGREFRLEEAPEIASRIVSKSATQVTLPAVEAAPDRSILSRDSGLGSEPVAAREIVGNIENRVAELALKNAANSAQQPGSNVTGSAATAPISGATSLPSTSQHNPLPPQLESMSLVRSADTSEWSNGLSERINWMVNQKQNTATIRLDPPALGKLDVQIKIADDATMITIQAQTAQTRDLIDSASIRLRDFLQDSGYQNVNVDVSQRQDQQQARSQASANINPDQDDNSGQEQAADNQPQQQASYFSGEGLVDTFA